MTVGTAIAVDTVADPQPRVEQLPCGTFFTLVPNTEEVFYKYNGQYIINLSACSLVGDPVIFSHYRAFPFKTAKFIR